MNRLCAVLMFLVAVALVACSDDIETSRLVDDSGVGLLALGETIDKLPCDESNKGKFVYVADSSEVYYCTDGEWARVNGEDGADGKDGKNGTDGKDGKNGSNGGDGAKCDVAGFEDGFTILCGDNKTVVNLKSLMPDTCAISDETEKGFKVTCGKDSVWQKAGKDAREPVRCTIADAGDGTALFVCGSDTVVVARAQCGGNAYDPDKNFCYNDKIFELCDGKVYDVAKYFCHFGALKALCGGASYDPATRFCSDDLLYDMCGMSLYDTETEFCDGYQIFDKCKGEKYDPKSVFCYKNTIYSKCYGSAYNPETHFCDSRIYELCGGKSYSSQNEFCSEGTIYQLCNQKSYDTKIYFCDGKQLYYKCGGSIYTPSSQFCLDGKIYPKCGMNSSYDPAKFTCRSGVLYGTCGTEEYQVQNQVCVGTTVLDKCGADGAYDATKYFCQNGKMYPLCNGKTYNGQTKFCKDGTLYDRCGTEEYDPGVYFWQAGVLVHKCGGQVFDVEQNFCIDGKIFNLCENRPYDPDKYFCGANNELLPFCEGKAYDSKKYFCYDDKLYDLCSGKTYRPISGGRCVEGTYYYDNGGTHYFIDMRDNRLYRYVTVGNYMWMVDFLKIEYTESTTQCPYNSEAHCNSSGRMYTWAAAMDSLQLFSNQSRGSGNGVGCVLPSTTRFRGICPSGWRLPRSMEIPKDEDILNSPESQALALDGPGYSDAFTRELHNYEASYMWASTCSSDEHWASYISEAVNSSTVHFYEISRNYKYTLMGVRCVRAK